MRVARRRPLDLVAAAALLCVALYLLLAAARGGRGAHTAFRGSGGAEFMIDASSWHAALSAGAETVRHASAPRRAMTVR
jgi:hypothetical protein